jgi:hypothetical protein
MKVGLRDVGGPVPPEMEAVLRGLCFGLTYETIFNIIRGFWDAADFHAAIRLFELSRATRIASWVDAADGLVFAIQRFVRSREEAVVGVTRVLAAPKLPPLPTRAEWRLMAGLLEANWRLLRGLALVSAGKKAEAIIELRRAGSGGNAFAWSCAALVGDLAPEFWDEASLLRGVEAGDGKACGI